MPAKDCPHGPHETHIPSNVWLAADDEPELEKRFQSTTHSIENAPALKKRLKRYSGTLRSKLTVSINLHPESLINLISNPRIRYVNLHDNLKAEVVQDYDKRLASKRRAIDEMAFEYDGEKLNFGAVNFDDHVGLISYGSACIILKSGEIKSRVSFLENNAFSYYSESGGRKSFNIPEGVRALWHSMAKLVIVKHAKEFFGTDELTTKEISKVLLCSTGDKSTDQYIEAQIFPPINGRTISKIVLSMSAWRRVNNNDLVGQTARHMEALLREQTFLDYMRQKIQQNLTGVELKVVEDATDC